MAEVVLATALQVQKWSDNLTREYIRANALFPYMGTENTSIIRMLNEFKDKGGDTINFPMITRIKGRGVRGSEILKGNETDLGLFNTAVTVDWRRNAVKVPKSTQLRTEINLLSEAKPQLRDWCTESLRDDVINEFASVVIPGALDNQGLPGTDQTVLYGFSTAAQRNAYLVNNSDRIVFGNARANITSGNWATSLGTVSQASGQSSAAHVRLLKTIAKNAGGAPVGPTGMTTNIRPFRADMTAGREWFVYFVGSREFGVLSLDPTIVSINTSSRPREAGGVDSNPLFQDGDLMYQGVIIREVPELDQLLLPAAGSGGTDLAMGFLCGQSAIAVGIGQTPQPRTDYTEDYGFRPAVAIEELRGVKKTSYGGVQYGVVTSVTAVPALA